MCAQIIGVQFGEFSQAGHPGNQHQNRSKTKHFGLPEGPSVTLSATTHVLRVLRAESYLPGRIRTEVDGITVLCAAAFAQDHGLGIRLWRRVEPQSFLLRAPSSSAGAPFARSRSHATADGHLHCFRVGDGMNEAAMSIFFYGNKIYIM